MLGVRSAATLINSAVRMSGTCLQKRIWLRALLLGLHLHIYRRRLSRSRASQERKGLFGRRDRPYITGFFVPCGTSSFTASSPRDPPDRSGVVRTPESLA